MEEILGRRNSDRAFDRYLANWRGIMASRIDQAISALAAIDGVHGMILAGSNGLGNPWPLSDIDLIPIYLDDALEAVVQQVEHLRLKLLDEWSTEGWRTGLDIGRLHFRLNELESVFASDDPDPVSLINDDRWYYSIDKGYGGRATIDRDGSASRLASWYTTKRFMPEVVALRLARSAREAHASLARARQHTAEDDEAAAYEALLKSVQWSQINLMELWGERDNSLGRFGTRFEAAAKAHELHEAVDAFNEISVLDATNVSLRLAASPPWVHERNDRSWKARLAIGESLSKLQSDRDVLRVCTMYELRVAAGPPFAEWLGVPDASDLSERVATLGTITRLTVDSAQSPDAQP